MKRVMFCLLAAFGLASALAAQEPVAQIGGTTYPSLQAAFDEAADGATVTLLRNTDISGVGARVVRSLTLDLNGQTLSADNSKKGNLDVATGATLTLTDSTDTKKNGTGKGKILATQNYTSGNSGYSSGVVSVEPGATLVMERGLIDARRENPVANGQYGVVMNGSSTATIRGGAIHAGWYAIAGNGNDKETTSTITVEGGILESTADYAIYHPQGGTLTISGGTVAGAAGGVSINRGSCNITGGVVSSAGTGDTGDWGDGTGGQGKAAITVGARYDDVKLDISGGVITAPEGVACIATEETTHSADIAITGGTFSAALPAEFYSEGYLPVLTEEGTYEVSDTAAVASVTTESGTIGYPSLQAAFNAVTAGQTITLLANVTDTPRLEVVGGKQVTIDLNGHDIGFAKDGYFHVYGGSLTLTGEGKVYEQSPYWGAILIHGATQDVADHSVAEVGEGVTLEGWAPIFIDNNNGCAYGVKVTLAGTANAVADTSGATGHAIYINGTIQALDGNVPQITLTETSKVTSLANGIYAAGYAEWTLAGEIDALFPLSIKCGTFDITGGAYRATGPFADIAAANGNGSENTGAAVSITTNDGYAPKTVVNITGGTFTSENGYAFYEGIAKKADGTPAAEASTAVIAISGGTFKGSTTNEAIEDSSAIAIITAENKKVITGGAFSAKPDEAYLAEYYVTEDEAGADGLFAVAPTFDPTWYEEGSFVIQNVPDLLAFARVVNTDRDTFAGKTVTLAADLDLAGVAWTPIGEGNVGGASKNNGFFAGTFDGQNHTIANVSASQTGTSPGSGLFGWVRGATIKDLSVSGNLTSKESAVGIVGIVDAGNGLTATTLASVVNLGGTVRGAYAGGIVGAVQGGTVMLNGCVNHAAVTAWMNHSDAVGALCAGGIVGDAQGGSVSLGACDNMGTVSAYPDEEGVNKTLAVAGGVVGRMGTGTVTGCTGGEADLSGTTNEGRIIGALATPETEVALTLTPSAAEYETGRVALFTATDVPANLTVTAEPADGQEAADETDLAVEGGTLYCNLLYLADRVEGATEGVSFDDNAKQCLAAVAPYGHFTVTGESAGRALTTEEVNDALACFKGDGLVVADGQSLKVGYQFGIVGASYKAGTLTVTAQVRDLAGNPLAFADAEGLTLVDAATGDPIVGASAQVDEDAPGTVTFTATLQNAPETLRLAVKASTTAAD